MRLRLGHHTIDEWCAVQAAQLERLGCSPEFIKQHVASLRERYELR